MLIGYARVSSAGQSLDVQIEALTAAGCEKWPDAVGKPDSYVMLSEGGMHPALSLQNRGLDSNHSGKITRGEVTSVVQMKLEAGLLPANAA